VKIILVGEFSPNGTHKVGQVPHRIGDVKKIADPDNAVIEIDRFDGAVALVVAKMLNRTTPKGVALKNLNGSTPKNRKSLSWRYNRGVTIVFQGMLSTHRAQEVLPRDVTEPVMRAISQPLERILDLAADPAFATT